MKETKEKRRAPGQESAPKTLNTTTGEIVNENLQPVKDFRFVLAEIMIDPFHKIGLEQLKFIEVTSAYLIERGIGFSLTPSGNFRYTEPCECGGSIFSEATPLWRTLCTNPACEPIEVFSLHRKLTRKGGAR